jgi:class 3 adenylate cyclase/tetratricopeptide (TPR) repeat protein
MQCPECQVDNRDGVKFCEKCGAKMEFVCPNCGDKIPFGTEFCGACGIKVSQPLGPPSKELSFDEKLEKIQRYLPKGLTKKILSQKERIEGERKQVTVMFCDMVGFTQLSEGLGPEEAYTVMDQVYEILIHKVHDYEGTVNEFTGDGIMALFGAPIALEEAPQRAIRSAYAIHREMAKFSDKMKQGNEDIPPFKMRIGIHTGPVVVGTLGNDLRVEFKAVGDTVNLASRMEGLAQPGCTYVTEDTFRLTEGLFRFEVLGEHAVKGRADAVKAYRVIAPSTRRTRFDVSAERGLTPFVGRERELELLLDGFERSKAGRGQAFSVLSEAGMGKSRLLYEFRKAVANENVTFMEGKCLSYSRGVAYHPIIDLFKSNFYVQEGDGDSEITGKVKKGLKILGADEASNLPYLLELLSVKESGIDQIAMSPESRKDRMVETMIRIPLKGSEIRPLIMAVEDLHWVDNSSEDVLKYLLERISGARILLIFTHRPEYEHTFRGKSYHSQLTLNRFSNKGSLSMVRYLLGTEEIDRDLEEFILEKTDGVPFFIEEFVKSLNNLKILEKIDNKYRITKDIKGVTIPATVQDILMARIDSLSEEIKGLLQIGSVIGREFSYDLIKRVTGLSDAELHSHLSASRDAELLYERGIYPQSTYIFKHALTQEVTYNSLLHKMKKAFHEKIGKAIEALYPERIQEYYELLAYHYAHSANTNKAVEYLCRANRKAIKLHAFEEAMAYFDDAMKLLRTMPETDENRKRQIDLLLNQWFVFQLLLKLSEYYDLLTQYEPMALELENPGLLGAFYVRIGHCEWSFGYTEKSIQTATKGAELCEAGGNVRGAAGAYATVQWGHAWKGDYDKVIALKGDILRKMEQQFILRWYVWAFCGTSLAYGFLGLWDLAIKEGKEALRVADENSDNSLISFAAYIISNSYANKWDLDRATEYAEIAFQKAPTLADKMFAKYFLAWASCRAGEPQKGIETLAELLPMQRAVRFRPTEMYCVMYLGEGYWLAGEHDKARQTLKDALELAKSCEYRFHSGWAQRLLGEIALKTEPPKAALYFEKSITLLREIKAENELALTYSGYGRFHKQQGNIEQARKYLTKSLEIFERLGTLVVPDKVRETLEELP